MSDLPRWKCHKEVEGFEIAGIVEGVRPYTMKLIPALGETCKPVFVGMEYMNKHKPEVGGYYVRYLDGYESYSPAGPFEGGYTRITSPDLP